MGFLKEYLIGIISLIFIITAIEIISPDNSTKKYLNYVMGLILIGVILNPIVKIFDSGISFPDLLEKDVRNISIDQQKNDKDFKKQTENQIAKNFQIELKSLIENQLKESFPDIDFDVSVKAENDNGNMNITKIDVNGKNNGIKPIEKVVIDDKLERINEESTQIEDEIKKNIENTIKIQNLVINVHIE